MTWYKVAWIDPLFAALNTIAPNRDKSSDGTIGDLAHMSGTSGHNPDDTPGVSAERSDADSKPEVRAADADSDLRQPGITMHTVVAAVLGHPPDRDRLIYIISERTIYRKATGWRAEPYTGNDPHVEHAHFSGDPASDEDGRPWSSILALGDDMFSEADRNSLTDIQRTLGSFIQGYDKTIPQTDGKTYPILVNVLLKKIAAEVNIDPAELAAIKAAAEAGAAAATDDIVAGVLAGLPEGTLTQQDVETTIRSVLGGLDGATPAS